jgi:hypothetical protein
LIARAPTEDCHAPVLQIVTLAVVAVALSAALAHALEVPGKMRLTKDEYFVVQSIYYPGFTIAGAAELLAIIVPADRWEYSHVVRAMLAAVSFMGLAIATCAG